MGFDPVSIGVAISNLGFPATGAALSGMTGLGTALSIGSTALSAFGSLSSGRAEANAAKYNSAVAANNAELARRNAAMAGHEGEQQAETQQMKNRAKLAAITAQQGASGVDIGSGSSVDVRASQEALGQLDVANIRANAARRAYGYQTEATGYDNQAAVEKAAAKNAKTASYVEAGTTLLGNAYQISPYEDWQLTKGLSYGA